MIFFKKKDEIKEEAKYLLDVAKKIEHYRKDILTKEQLCALLETRRQMGYASGLSQEDAYKSFDAARQFLKSIGGDIYPMMALVEHAEVFLFAAILALTLRTFFFQPFRIPTNSMWPTYAGMTFELVRNQRSVIEKIKRWTCWGASNYNAKTNDAGTICIPIAMPGKETKPYGGILHYKVVTRKKFFGLLSSQEREYTFMVGSHYTTLRVPLEFVFDDVALATLFPQAKSWSEILNHQSSGRFRRVTINKDNYKDEISYFDTNIQKSPGEDIFNFDILTGDMLFVDKISYHFSFPKIGDAFVFRTRNIEYLKEDKYFIKRLVGLPGDTLQVKRATLYRNDRPIEGAEAFDLNHRKVEKYPGYTNSGLLDKGYEVEVPQKYYFAMGDNSPHSYDSRGWGFIPNREVVGKAIFILYPFTRRWGCAK